MEGGAELEDEEITIENRTQGRSILKSIQDKWFLCTKCRTPTESVTVYVKTKDGEGFTWNKPHRACLNCNLLFREHPIKSFPLNRLGLIRLKRVRLLTEV